MHHNPEYWKMHKYVHIVFLLCGADWISSSREKQTWRISTPDNFKSTDVDIVVWVPDDTGIFYNWSQKGLITQHFGFTRTLMDVSLEESTSWICLCCKLLLVSQVGLLHSVCFLKSVAMNVVGALKMGLLFVTWKPWHFLGWNSICQSTSHCWSWSRSLLKFDGIFFTLDLSIKDVFVTGR